MPQSLSQLYIHIIFHVRYDDVLIRENEESELYKYIGGIIKESGSVPLAINGTKDHMHILCKMSKNIALSKLVENIKRNSSRWIKSKDNYYKSFAWQGGYAGFSVSQSKMEIVRQYIRNQKEHHCKQTFKDEYIVFLQEYNIDYDETYLWV
ncbi:REP element-mobilizing transposase RayT [Dysgonomonas hofstadii]|uniref:REP element-mobilizing transposase RayT n=1 Tax=Dysgonomonas hofstadii TaxID=637886 RepID=A0A840CUB4_9BACT|nr:IS200/IS605 family transposase [Dysgonomonas hofstadii]MBB4038269.1 REP element-mobilizing transposase RayT [Dysgonomonas hofstadii]